MTKLRGLIILDGADCVGKTTLANKIAERAQSIGADPVIRHQGKPVEGTCWQVHSDALLEYLQEAFNEEKLVIGDRHFLSEAIYGSVYRTGSEYPYAVRHIDRLLHRFRALRVICAPPIEDVVKMHAEMKKIRFEEYDSGMDKVGQRYKDLWSGAHSGTSSETTNWVYDERRDYIEQLTMTGGVSDKNGWYHYDYTKTDTDTYARFLLHELETEQALIPDDLLDMNDWKFTGFPSKQSVLLVGDKVLKEGASTIPFYDNQDASGYLAHTLQKIRADESRVVIANVNDYDGVYTVRALSQMCGRVIVMGRHAEKTMLTAGLDYDARIRDPQDAMQFSFHDDTYAHEMLIAMKGMAGIII
jgi:thymidylate kinase